MADTTGPNVPLVAASQYTAAWLEDYKERVESRVNGIPRGPVTGLKRLDSMLGGCLMPGLHFVTGKAGTGKSALLLQIALNCGVPVVYLTCELSPHELLNRLICVTSGTTIKEIKSGHYPVEDVRNLVRNLEDRTSHLYLMDGSAQYPERDAIVAACETARSDNPSQRMLLIIDSFHAWSAMSTISQTEYMNLREHVTTARQISSRLKAPILLASEQNRVSKDGSGGQAAAKGYGVEYSAETLVNLELDSEPQLGREVRMKVFIEKNRHGPTYRYADKSDNDGYCLMYDRWTQRFRETT